MNWLESMGEALVLHKKDNVRLVSARSDSPCNDRDGLEGLEELRLEYSDFNDKNLGSHVKVVDTALPMYCFMCHRGLFERIGPIKPYPFTWYENEEFFYRMKRSGFKQAIAMRSWVHHEGSGTVNYLLKNNNDGGALEEEMHKNRERCVQDLRQLYQGAAS